MDKVILDTDGKVRKATNFDIVGEWFECNGIKYLIKTKNNE